MRDVLAALTSIWCTGGTAGFATVPAAGLTAAELSRLASPIGLDLGAHTPEETSDGGERPLTETDDPIHHDAHRDVGP